MDHNFSQGVLLWGFTIIDLEFLKLSSLAVRKKFSGERLGLHPSWRDSKQKISNSFKRNVNVFFLPFLKFVLPFQISVLHFLRNHQALPSPDEEDNQRNNLRI